MPNYYNQYYPTQSNAYPTQMNVGTTQPTQIQSGGFVSLPNENMVNSYPVAPGNCVTFKVEGQPIVLEKSMGFSQLEAPKIRRFRLVEENIVEESTKVDSSEDIESLKADIKKMWGEINAIKNRKTRPDKGGED
mgnify:CR=1 FL=1